MTLELSVVVPTFESGAHIQRNMTELLAWLDQHSETYELVIVDDGSTDTTWAKLQGLTHPALRAFRLARNVGQHEATRVGICRATGKAIVTIDDDLQSPPPEIRVLQETAERSGADAVLGMRPWESRPLIERFVLRAWRALAGGRYVTRGSSFRWISSPFASKICAAAPGALIDDTLFRTGARLVTVDTVHRTTPVPSRYGPWGRAMFAWNAIKSLFGVGRVSRGLGAIADAHTPGRGLSTAPAPRPSGRAE